MRQNDLYIFEKFQKRDGWLRSSDGWLYGYCARKLHYCNKTGLNAHTKHELLMMETGKREHLKIQELMISRHPSLKAEQYFELHSVYGRAMTTHLDLCNNDRAIEIKPSYKNNISAYIQTLLQKFIRPDLEFYIFEYITYREFRKTESEDYSVSKALFPIKTDVTMSRVYTLRVCTALDILPPRHPQAKDLDMFYKCKYCIHKPLCREDDDYPWDDFTKITKDIEKNYTTIP